MNETDVIIRTITAKSEDITILYDIFKNMGKMIQVDDLKNEFYSIFNSGDKQEIEARFWDSLTPLQYIGFLMLSDNDERVTKLDFALSTVCTNMTLQISWTRTIENKRFISFNKL